MRNPMTTLQQTNFTADNYGQCNFGKAVLAIASAKAKEVHWFIILILVCTTFAFAPTLKYFYP